LTDYSLTRQQVWFHYRRQQEKTTTNLQNLKIHDLPPEVTDGARMILPGDLQQLLDIFPTKQVLVVDLRAPSAFEKSHIHGAINLRAPVSFIEATSLEMIQDTFTDDQSRRTFAQWSHTRCVVFYGRVVEFAWECPVADAVYDKFRRQGWEGECFVLKGHYHEFLTSYDKYISGQKMTKRAKEYLDSQRQRSASDAAESEEAEGRYAEWLRERAASDRAAPAELIPSKKAERVAAVEEHQRELEAELKMRFPALYKKALALRPTRTPTYRTVDPAPGYSMRDKRKDVVDAFDPALVEPLVRGLEKMREAAAAAGGGGGDGGGAEEEAGKRPVTPGTPLPKYNRAATGTSGGSGEVDKLGDPVGTPASDEFDDFENDESMRSDPGFQKAGAKGDAADDGHRKGKVQAQTQTQGSGHSFWRFRIKPGSK
jgi:rhodanese-related sulfurtransferase